MSKTIIAVRHFGLGGRESLETAVSLVFILSSRTNVEASKVIFDRVIPRSVYLFCCELYGHLDILIDDSYD